MARFADTLLDEVTGAPIAGAFVYVFATDGTMPALADDSGSTIPQPIITPQTGTYYFNTSDGIYTRKTYVGARLKREDSTLIGQPPEFSGPSGPANSTYTTLTALKAAPASNVTYTLAVPGQPRIEYVYAAGNFATVADDYNVIALSSVSASVGALIRQVREAVVSEFNGGLPGLGDNTAAINAALASVSLYGGSVYFRGGSVPYNTNGGHKVASSVRVRSDRRAATLNVTTDAIVFAPAFDGTTTSHSVMIEGLRFTSNDFSANPVSDGGIIDFTGGNVRNWRCERLTFDTPNLNRDLIHLGVSAGTTAKGFYCNEIVSSGSGRFGIEIVQHDQGDVSVCQDIRITGCTLIAKAGQNNAYAMLVSISGNMRQVLVDGNQLTGTGVTNGLELVGDIQGLRVSSNNWSGAFNNLIQNTANPAGGRLRAPVFIGNTTEPGRGPTYSNFPIVAGQMPPATTGTIYLANCDSGLFAGNNIDLGLNSTVLFLTAGTTSMRVRGNRLSTQHTNAILIQGANNWIEGNDIELRGAPGTPVILDTMSAGNRVRRNAITSVNTPNSYVLDNGTSTANPNIVGDNDKNGVIDAPYGVPALPASGHFLLAKTGKVVLNLADHVAPIDPNDPNSWYMFCLEVDVTALDSSGGNPSRAFQKLYYSWEANQTPAAQGVIDLGTYPADVTTPANGNTPASTTPGLKLNAALAQNQVTLSLANVPGSPMIGWNVRVATGLDAQYFAFTTA